MQDILAQFCGMLLSIPTLSRRSPAPREAFQRKCSEEEVAGMFSCSIFVVYPSLDLAQQLTLSDLSRVSLRSIMWLVGNSESLKIDCEVATS